MRFLEPGHRSSLPVLLDHLSVCLEGGWERWHSPLFSLVRNWDCQGLQGAGGHWLCGQACDH